jgi:hypothetical protein
MKSTIVLLFVIYSICPGQTDSMIVEKMDGTIRSYPISSIKKIYFSSEPTSVREQELVKTVFTSFTLYQNYPNPFNPSTTIQYNIPKSGYVEVKIYDVQGRLVRMLYNSNQQVGTYTHIWDSRNSDGSTVASGIYYCQVLYNGSSLVKKLMLIK